MQQNIISYREKGQAKDEIRLKGEMVIEVVPAIYIYILYIICMKGALAKVNDGIPTCIRGSGGDMTK